MLKLEYPYPTLAPSTRTRSLGTRLQHCSQFQTLSRNPLFKITSLKLKIRQSFFISCKQAKSLLNGFQSDIVYYVLQEKNNLQNKPIFREKQTGFNSTDQISIRVKFSYLF